MENVSAPGSVAELLARIDRGWNGLWLLVAQSDAGQMETPDASSWSLKDNLAHLAAWERYLVEHTIQRRPPHEIMAIDALTMATLDETGLNAIIQERSRNHTLADVIADLRQTHQAVVSAVAILSYDDLLRPLDAADPEQTLLLWVIGNTYEHYEEHAAMILTLLEHQG